MASKKAAGQRQKSKKHQLIRQFELFVLLPVLLSVLLGMLESRFHFIPSRAEFQDKAQRLLKMADRLRPLHEELGPSKPGDWLAVHFEPGQSFRQYLRAQPITPTERRKIIYVLPIGDFDGADEQILKLTGEFLGLYFDLPVTFLEPAPAVAYSGQRAPRQPRHSSGATRGGMDH
jgi:hypothetical protein